MSLLAEFCRDPILIGLVGYAGSGKSAAADYLEDRHHYIQAAFAAALKEDVLEPMLANLNIDHAALYEPGLKEQVLPGWMNVTARQLMQEFGDAGRRCAPDWWVRQLAGKLGLDWNNESPVHDRIVISDVRYPNEAAWIRSRGGALVRISRLQAAAVREHSSEQHVNSIACDLTIYNNGPTLMGLHSLVDAALRDLGLAS